MVDLVILQRYSATDAAGATDAMQAVFGVGVATVESLGSLRYEQRSLVDDGISVTRISSSGALLRMRAAPSPDMVVVAVRSGYALLQHGSETVALEAGDIGLIPLEHPLQARWEQVTMDFYSFPRSSLSHLLGSDAEQLSIRAARLKAVSPEVVALWLRTATILGSEVLQSAELSESDIIREQTIDSLLGLTIEAFGIVDAREDDTSKDDDIVQRATEYLRRNLHRSVTVADMARAVGVSVRGLQLAFRRTGTGTPLGHLRALRMAAANDALTGTAADRPTTEIAAARGVGYSNLGRFNAHYREAFGETPLETLSTVGTPA